MMDSLRLMIYIVYRYYSSSGKRMIVAYLQTIMSSLLALYINLICVLNSLNVIPNGSFIDTSSDEELIGMLKIGVFFFLPGYLLLRLMFKEDDLKKMSFDEETIKRGKGYLIRYAIITGVLIVISSTISIRRIQ